MIGVFSEAVDFLMLATNPRQKIVVFTDYPVQKWAKVYARDRYKTNVRTIKTWNQLVKQLKPFTEIERLVLFFHGDAGSVTIHDGPHKTDQNLGMVDLAGHKIPRIERIEFASCRVATGPVQLVKFAKALGAAANAKPPIIEAYDYWYIPDIWTIETKMTKAKIEAHREWKRFSGYWMADPPHTSTWISKQPVPVLIGAEWFHATAGTKLPAPSREGGRSPFKTRKSAKDLVIKSEEEAKALKPKYQTAPDVEAPPPTASWQLRRVIIDLS